MPISLVISTVSSSSYKSSSIWPPPNTPASDLAIWSRDLVRPCLRRAAQPGLAGSSAAACSAAAAAAYNRHGGGHGGDAVGLFERIGCGMAAQFGRRGFGRGLRHMNSAHRRFGSNCSGSLSLPPPHRPPIGSQGGRRHLRPRLRGHVRSKAAAARIRPRPREYGRARCVCPHAGRWPPRASVSDGRSVVSGRLRSHPAGTGFGRMGFGVGDVVGKAAQRMRGGIGGHGFARVSLKGCGCSNSATVTGMWPGSLRVLGRCNGRCGFGRFNRLGVLLGRGSGVPVFSCV